jgi:hypothetical protein
MKKRQIGNLLLLSIIVLVMIEFAFAIEITLSKDNYSPKETLQAQITGNFDTLANENINLYEKGIPRPVPVISELTKQGDVYFYYATLPNKGGNYTFVIENTKYLSQGEENTSSIIKNFTIIKTNFTSLSVTPGFVITEDDFKIKVTSPFHDASIVATLTATNQSRIVDLIESEEKTIDFSVVGINSNRTDVKIGEYSIPVFVTSGTTPIYNQKFIFAPSEIIATVSPGNSYFFNIVVQNFGDVNISNIRLSSNLNATAYPDIFDLEKGERKIINLTIPVSPKAKNNISGEININHDNKSEKIYVFFNITTNESRVNLTGTTVIPSFSCAGKGNVCVYPEKCSGDTTDSLEGPCCLGKCGQVAPPADYGWIFGVILLAILAGLAFFLVKRAKQRQKLKTSGEILDEKSRRFDKRMNLPEKVPDKEVSGKLGRV